MLLECARRREARCPSIPLAADPRSPLLLAPKGRGLSLPRLTTPQASPVSQVSSVLDGEPVILITEAPLSAFGFIRLPANYLS